jgi:hypothetical protein
VEIVAPAREPLVEIADALGELLGPAKLGLAGWTRDVGDHTGEGEEAVA